MILEKVESAKEGVCLISYRVLSWFWFILQILYDLEGYNGDFQQLFDTSVIAYAGTDCLKKIPRRLS
jgi:hypothetical protein